MWSPIRWRRLLAILTTSAGLAASGVAAKAETPAPICFEAWRNGDQLGHHRVRFHRDGDTLTAAIAIDYKVALGPLTLFTYSHRNRETWRDGRLVAIATRTNDDGDHFFVNGRATADGFQVTSSAGPATFPADVMPTSYWQAYGKLDQRVWLDTQGGRRLSLTASVVSPPRGAENGTSLEGEISLIVGYDGKGRWSGLRFSARGSTVDYVQCAKADDALWSYRIDDIAVPKGAYETSQAQ